MNWPFNSRVESNPTVTGFCGSGSQIVSKVPSLQPLRKVEAKNAFPEVRKD